MVEMPHFLKCQGLRKEERVAQYHVAARVPAVITRAVGFPLGNAFGEPLGPEHVRGERLHDGNGGMGRLVTQRERPIQELGPRLFFERHDMRQLMGDDVSEPGIVVAQIEPGVDGPDHDASVCPSCEAVAVIVVVGERQVDLVARLVFVEVG